MELTFGERERAFQAEVRDFIAAKLPKDIAEKVAGNRKLERDDYVRWQRILNERGWLAPSWPEEYGGLAWDPVQLYLFDEELGRASAPRIMPFGTKMVGPVIYTFGNEAQKRRFLPRILASEDWWCQGYSEPGAGSDLASLKTRAVRQGDRYIVNGTKTWTSFAHYADWMFCLVRTDTQGKPQEGISFLLIDMRQPGVEVKPIVTIDGTADVNMVFLTDVEVPVENLIGKENKGWTYAKFLLGHERSGIAGVGRSKAQLARLKEIARLETAEARPLIEDATFRNRIAELEIELRALEMTELRYLMDAHHAGRPPGAETSLLKVRGTDIQQMLTELLAMTIGYYANPYVREAMDYGWNEAPIGPPYGSHLASTYFNWRKASIYGGSNEIQRNIIAKMVLGL